MKIGTIGRLLALSVGGLAGAVGNASAEEGVKGLPADLYDCRTIGPENRIEPPPPLVPAKGPESYSRAEQHFLEANKLKEDPCPAGKVPYPEANPFPAAPPHPRGFGSGGTAEKPELRNAAAAPRSDNPNSNPANYRYVEKTYDDYANGVSIDMNVADPEIEEAGLSHSIAEVYMAGTPNPVYSVELGWMANRWREGPYLFTFADKDNYVSYGQPGGDCYNCGFIPWIDAEYVPGQALVPSEDGTETLRMGITLNNGHWWIWVGDQWIGYIGRGFWPERSEYSSSHSFYGEVYDGGTGKTDMGNGTWAYEPGASIMKDPAIHVYKNGSTNTIYQPVTPNNAWMPWDSDENMYTYWTNQTEDQLTWWKFGGPGTN